MAVTGLLPILVLAALILVLGGRLLLQGTRGHSRPVTIDDYCAARAALDSVFVETAAMKRIFAVEDMEFISKSGAPHVRRFFVKERKKLAIQWLCLTKKQVAQLMDLHLKLASYTWEPSPKFEFKLTVKYLDFLLASNGLLVMLRLFGPFAVLGVASHTVRSAEHFCSVFSIRLEKVDSVRLGSPR